MSVHEHGQGWTPAAARDAVHARQGGRCGLCWEPLGPVEGSWEAHHRLRRGLMPRDALWCPCDVVGLHPRCHTQGPGAVHDHPVAARRVGLMLGMDEDPRLVVVHVGWPWDGPAFLACDGDVVSTLG